MNVLFLTHYDGFYGSSRSLMNLLQGLQKYDIKPFVVIPREGNFTNTLSASNIPYEITPIVNWVTEKSLSFNRKKQLVGDFHQSVKTIRQLVREWDIDIIYTNSSVSPVGRLVSMLERIPHIWHIREFGDLDHSLKWIFPKSISQELIKSSTEIICNSNAVKNYYFKSGRKRVHVVYNGIATRDQFDAFYSHKNEIRKQTDTIFGIIGTIKPKKGQKTAIKAISELYKRGLPVRLVIAGNGKKANVDQCKQLIETLNISNIVEYRGFVDDPYEIYFASNCLLMCSEYEAMGRVTVEAMSACLPVIGKNSGGTPEIIEQEKTGLLYNTFDELVEAMMRMVNNPEWRRQLGLEGWRVAKERFNIEDYASNIYEIIQLVLES